jgi:hypothetical protein
MHIVQIHLSVHNSLRITNIGHTHHRKRWQCQYFGLISTLRRESPRHAAATCHGIGPLPGHFINVTSLSFLNVNAKPSSVGVWTVWSVTNDTIGRVYACVCPWRLCSCDARWARWLTVPPDPSRSTSSDPSNLKTPPGPIFTRRLS